MAYVRNHIHSPLYKWMLVVIDMSAVEPQIRVAECDNVMEIELIQKIRIEEINPVQ